MQKVNYADLNPRQQECYNFQKISAVLAEYGFECIKLSDDWKGADFIAYNFDGKTSLKVQLKGRLTIRKKYVGKSLHVAFPSGRNKWIVVPHDTLLEIISQVCPRWLETDSWLKKGEYHRRGVGKALLPKLKEFELASSDSNR